MKELARLTIMVISILATTAFAQDETNLEIEGDLGSFTTDITTELPEAGLELVTLTIKSGEAAIPPEFTVKWVLPSSDIQGQWSPRISLDKANFYFTLTSRAARYAPVFSLFNSSDVNRMTAAASDGLRSIDVRSYVREEDALFYNYFTFFKEKTPAIKEYTVTLRIDRRPIPLVSALKDVADWWASMENYKPAPVPGLAKRPMYSTWYSFHQNITADEVVEQCALSRELGFEAVIVDDGWQTMDSNRGYAYTGDWEPVRIGDMKDFVDRVHALDMKFLLWYSLSLMGEKSKNFEKYKDKYLWYWEGQGSYVLDPRYPEVREFIIQTYEKALVDWNLDGFKLDFIGMFRPDDKTVFTAEDGRDYASLDEAVDTLMTDIMQRLRSIKPDIMIEFRQPYVGPLMRKYGNMFRATDCPNMALVNRVRTTDVRLICGDTAVHSDMFMWHETDTVESAALQILNILYSVPQLSVKLNHIPEQHKKMVRFWISYWNANQDVLIEGEFLPVNPSANYPLIRGYARNKVIATIYNNMVVTLPDRPITEIDIINASGGERVVLDLAFHLGDVIIDIYNCIGEKVGENKIKLDRGVHSFRVPNSGLLALRPVE